MVLCFIHVAGMLVLGVGWKGPSVLSVLGLPTRLLGPPHSMVAGSTEDEGTPASPFKGRGLHRHASLWPCSVG